MNILYAFELQRHLTAVGSPITVIAVHPGLAVNTLFHKPPQSNFIVKLTVFLFLVNQDQGAYNSAFAAGSEEVAKYQPKVASDRRLAKELWDTVDKFLEEKGI